MNERDAIRKRVWSDLRQVARPDSRFHWDFTSFIPDFEGSERCGALIGQLAPYREAQTVFAAPDNNLVSFRARCLADNKNLIVPTYGLARGFWQIASADVPAGLVEFAATLDGLERFARPYPVESVSASAGASPTLLVTGASVINTAGVRISTGPSYFDLEWLILRSLRVVAADTLIVTTVHDCQVVDWPDEPQVYASVADLIVTPTRQIQTRPQYSKPDHIDWEQLPWDAIQEVPLLMRLYQQQRPAR